MRTLYLLGCAAPPVLHLHDAVERFRAEGWQVCVALTPTAADWTDEATLRTLGESTVAPVRTRWRRPGEPKGGGWPTPDAVVLAPATLHTINALALGLMASHVVGIAVEMMGRGVPMVVLPCVNTVLTKHPQFDRSVAELRAAGVRVLLGEGGFVPNEPGAAGSPADFPWHLAIGAVRP